TFRAALARLEAGGAHVVARSSIWRTPPWGKTDQPAFLNACIRVETALAPHQLLALCLATETALGRVRTEKWGPRTLDLDLLDVAGVTLATPDLTLPHPFLAERAFVLAPLGEIAPDRVIGGRSVRAMLAAIDAAGLVPIGPLA
ncbi:MAG: 2-amino-4-hydroxy-6-hydroxymethyldihydropteridine diphosphokinase, partial [Phyllobacteriaceae bacterium]|nr:2-amino-4-hydroxy-6-hydroxymethyldihydropteridine diphosphokinase [Phyllobacteriaceae bacterium]